MDEIKKLLKQNRENYKLKYVPRLKNEIRNNFVTDNDFYININSIQKSILNAEKSHVILNERSEFKCTENNLYFQYGVAEFDKYIDVNYQYQLEGMYNEWSNWSTNSEASFENLPYGDYTFRVKAKVGDQVSENSASYSFTINRPWYLSNLMIGFYVVFFIILIGVVHLIYKRNFNKQKRLLLIKKQREHAFSQLENEKV